MCDVFISYSSKDTKSREEICGKLEAAGIKCWYAPRDIRPGEEWADAITNALQRCKVFLLIFTENANDSSQVLREVGLAADFKKTIIPFNTHAGSRDGGTYREIAALEPDATVLDGIAVAGERASGAEADVLNWLAGLDY